VDIIRDAFGRLLVLISALLFVPPSISDLSQFADVPQFSWLQVGFFVVGRWLSQRSYKMSLYFYIIEIVVFSAIVWLYYAGLRESYSVLLTARGPS
jgi:magnesium-transporting ATPase (P-type)